MCVSEPMCVYAAEKENNGIFCDDAISYIGGGCVDRVQSYGGEKSCCCLTDGGRWMWEGWLI